MDYQQLNIFDFLNNVQPYKIPKHKKIRLIELFGGVGSQAQALQRLNPEQGWESYRYVEYDKYPVKSYNAIFDEHYEPMDITKMQGRDLGIVDKDKYCYILVYSFPCQDISTAGKTKGFNKHNQQNGEATRSGLLWEVERLLDTTPLLPDVLIMENVSNILSKKFEYDWKMWLDYLASKGYSSEYKIMNAMDYGVAQSRKRCFCVSVLGNYSYTFPEPIPLTKRMQDYLEPEVDPKYYIETEKARELIDKLIVNGKILVDRPREQRKCIYCDNTLGKKGALGMCNKHYIQYKRWGDPLHADNKERATVDGYYRDGKTGRREHRVIWEQYYGETLDKDEIIHHINFVKTDNRIENLWKYPNASEHIKVHREYEKLFDSLTENEEIVFENGNYFKRERERADRQTVDLCTNAKPTEVANAIKAKDRGIENFSDQGNGVVEWSKQTNKQTISLSTNEPDIIDVANCIAARTDRGISSRKSEGSGVCECFRMD